MERILTLYRITSSPLAVVALVGANIIPLVGVLVLGWDLLTVLVVYWLENGVIGVFNVLRMATAGGGGGGAIERVAGKVVLIPFFCLHYGAFWAVHGVFVFLLPAFAAGDLVDGAPPWEGLDPWTLAIALVALVVSHGVSFWTNYLRAGEYRTASAGDLMGTPYVRVVTLHLTIIFGGMAILVTGAPVAALALLVVVKTIADLGFHLGEHRRLGRRSSARAAGT